MYLKVAMHNAHFMQVPNRVDYRQYYLACLVLAVVAFLDNPIEKFSAGHQF
jgi:hypothetical protein